MGSACDLRLAALALLAAASASAAEIRFDGAYDLRYNVNSNYLLDADNRLGQTGWAEHRLRLSPKIIEPGVIEIQTQFDIVSGLIAGQTAPSFGELGWSERSEKNGFKTRGFDFRYLFATLALPVGLVQVGQFPNHWGMGLVANSGECTDCVDFGELRFGDLVDGFLFATRPLTFLGPRSDLAKDVTMALSGQIIYRDRYASLVTRAGGGLAFNDVALQAVGALRWDVSELTRLGVYVARRSQSYAVDQGNLHAWVFDGYLRTEIPLPRWQSSVRLEAEGAEIYGGTTHAANLNSGSVRIAQQGLAARGTFVQSGLEAELELGYMSGDQNPFDASGTGFSANRDFKVGMVLWDEVMLFQTQNGARRLGDPALTGRPPPGLDLLPTQGAVTNAAYLNPKVRFTAPVPGGSLRAVLGVLFTRAPEPVADPYQSFLASAPRNAFGVAAGQSYGTEFDAGVTFRAPFGQTRKLGLELGAQYGVLLPGDVFQRSDGRAMGPVHALRFHSNFYF